MKITNSTLLIKLSGLAFEISCCPVFLDSLGFGPSQQVMLVTLKVMRRVCNVVSEGRPVSTQRSSSIHSDRMLSRQASMARCTWNFSNAYGYIHRPNELQ